jgi:hypothetical protein
MTYKDMISEVIGGYPEGGIDDKASDGAALDNFTMQYRETDWAFLKRMASRFNAGLVPSLNFEGPKIVFGVPQGNFLGDVDAFNYTIQKDIAYYMESSQNTNPDFTELDAVQFIVETEKDFDIGDVCGYQDLSLYAKSKSVNIIDGILRFTYALSTLKGLSQPTLFNEKITGLSLKGRVLEAVQDRIKVNLEIDEIQDKQTAWEFPYATMYTAEGNSGWYCMPEIDDTVLVYFPNKEERFGYGLNSIRTLNKETDKISDTDIKYFRTIDGKELKFSPEEILITCINGVDDKSGESKATYIRLNQDGGIEIATTESISFKSDKDITVEADNVIKVLASEQIRLKCKTSEIVIDTKVDLCGKEVKIN